MVMVATPGAVGRRSHKWRPAHLNLLPDDGNRYEVVEGQLFVTPAPSIEHQRVLRQLWILFDPYIRAQRLGEAFFLPGDLALGRSSLVIPDGMIIPFRGSRPRSWKAARRPILVVECLSSSTERRDRGIKRDLYRSRGIPEYWIVDRWERSVTIVQPNQDDRSERQTLVWHPDGATEALRIDLPTLFRAALDG